MECRLPAVDPALLARGEGHEAPRERLARLIAGWIADRTLPPGSRLPPVREAAAHCGVDKGTMVRVYRLLVERGDCLTTGRGTRSALVVPQRGGTAVHLPRTCAILTRYREEGLQEVAGFGGFMIAQLRGILAAIHDAGWSALLVHTDGAIAPEVLPAAIIVTHPVPELDHLLDRWQTAGVPIIVYGDLVERAGCDQVVCDHAAGTRLLVEACAARGRRRIRLHLPSTDLPWQRGRLAGYRAGMEATGLPVAPPLAFFVPRSSGAGREEWDGRVRACAGHLAEALTGPDAPDAILGISDGEALAIGAAAQLFHKRVHADVAVCGFDGYWRRCGELAYGPPVPWLSIDKQNERGGRELVAVMLDRVRGVSPPEPQVCVVAPILVEP